MQVQLAFAAGLVVVLLLIPINRWLAQQIQVASIAMMAAKDTRLSILQVWLLADLKQPLTCIMVCVRALRAAATFPELRTCCSAEAADKHPPGEDGGSGVYVCGQDHWRACHRAAMAGQAQVSRCRVGPPRGIQLHYVLSFSRCQVAAQSSVLYYMTAEVLRAR
jgi:hypothetical protein